MLQQLQKGQSASHLKKFSPLLPLAWINRPLKLIPTFDDADKSAVTKLATRVQIEIN